MPESARVDESVWELTVKREWEFELSSAPIEILSNIFNVKWWERSRVDESARELAVKREREFELSSTPMESLSNIFKVK